MVAKGERVGGGMAWEVEVSGYKLLYVEWINNCIAQRTIFNIL